MSPEEILAAAKEAAKDAAEELTLRRPKSKVINSLFVMLYIPIKWTRLLSSVDECYSFLLNFIA